MLEQLAEQHAAESPLEVTIRQLQENEDRARRLVGSERDAFAAWSHRAENETRNALGAPRSFGGMERVPSEVERFSSAGLMASLGPKPGDRHLAELAAHAEAERRQRARDAKKLMPAVPKVPTSELPGLITAVLREREEDGVTEAADHEMLLARLLGVVRRDLLNALRWLRDRRVVRVGVMGMLEAGDIALLFLPDLDDLKHPTGPQFRRFIAAAMFLESDVPRGAPIDPRAVAGLASLALITVRACVRELVLRRCAQTEGEGFRVSDWPKARTVQEAIVQDEWEDTCQLVLDVEPVPTDWEDVVEGMAAERELKVHRRGRRPGGIFVAVGSSEMTSSELRARSKEFADACEAELRMQATRQAAATPPVVHTTHITAQQVVHAGTHGNVNIGTMQLGDQSSTINWDQLRPELLTLLMAAVERPEPGSPIATGIAEALTAVERKDKPALLATLATHAESITKLISSLGTAAPIIADLVHRLPSL